MLVRDAPPQLLDAGHVQLAAQLLGSDQLEQPLDEFIPWDLVSDPRLVNAGHLALVPAGPAVDLVGRLDEHRGRLARLLTSTGRVVVRLDVHVGRLDAAVVDTAVGPPDRGRSHDHVVVAENAPADPVDDPEWGCWVAFPDLTVGAGGDGDVREGVGSNLSSADR